MRNRMQLKSHVPLPWNYSRYSTYFINSMRHVTNDNAPVTLRWYSFQLGKLWLQHPKNGFMTFVQFSQISLFLSLCVCVCVHTHARACVYSVYMYVCIYVYVYIYIYVAKCRTFSIFVPISTQLMTEIKNKKCMCVCVSNNSNKREKNQSEHRCVKTNVKSYSILKQ